jgi:quercetin dioxygenase-like cupin family protein
MQRPHTNMTRHPFWRGFVSLLAMMIATSSSAAAAMQPITRTVLEQRGIPGTDEQMEIILVVFQPGVAAPLHHHPVAGLNYILEGTAESAYGNATPKLYHAGDTLQDLPGLPHTVFRNADQHKVLRFLIFANIHAHQSYTIVP